MHKKMHMFVFTLLAAASLAVSGCSRDKPAEPVTELPEETESEADAGMVQSFIGDGYSGTVTYSISENGVDSEEAIAAWRASMEGMDMTFTDGEVSYVDKDLAAVCQEEGWREEDTVHAPSLLKVMRSPGAGCEDSITINDEECYHLSAASEDGIAEAQVLCSKAGLEAILGESDVDVYVSTGSKKVVRIDTVTPFIAGDTAGECVATFVPTDSAVPAIVRPQVGTGPAEEETEAYEEPAQPGTIRDDGALYQNPLFGIQLAGNGLYTFDLKKTAEMNGAYLGSKSSYTEEAYAAGNNIIVNVSSLKSDDAGSALSKYLVDSQASNIQSAGKVDVGEYSFLSSSATINSTPTRTYCCCENGRALIITVYYKGDADPAVFESTLYTDEEDPFWKPQVWELEQQYEAKTPEGYRIIEEDSNEFYVSMATPEGKNVNVFLMSGADAASQEEAEMEAEDGVTKELMESLDMSATDGTPVRYLRLSVKDTEYSYFIHIGLMQVGGSTIKLYAVDTDGKAEYSDVFINVASNIQQKEDTD